MLLFRFRQLAVYSDAKEFRRQVYAVCARFPIDEKYGLIGQLKRAATSIVLNLAEGSHRPTDADFRRFVNIAVGSLAETVACLDMATDDGYLGKEQHKKLDIEAEMIGKKLLRLSAVLKD